MHYIKISIVLIDRNFLLEFEKYENMKNENHEVITQDTTGVKIQ